MFDEALGCETFRWRVNFVNGNVEVPAPDLNSAVNIAVGIVRQEGLEGSDDEMPRSVERYDEDGDWAVCYVNSQRSNV